VVAWDDQSVDESWLGQFKFSNGQTLLSKSTDWEYIISKNSNPFSRNVPVAERDQGYLSGNFEGNLPKNGELAEEIQAGNWINAQYRGTNGVGANATNPWGNISEIDQNAEFLNTTTDSQLQAGTSGNTHYTIFRTNKSVAQLASVPEPSSMLGLLAFGAVSAGSFVKRKSKTV
jgi:PEP-CTERM motif